MLRGLYLERVVLRKSRADKFMLWIEYWSDVVAVIVMLLAVVFILIPAWVKP
jgi:Tfp pilus assembly protein PilO